MIEVMCKNMKVQEKEEIDKEFEGFGD